MTAKINRLACISFLLASLFVLPKLAEAQTLAPTITPAVPQNGFSTQGIFGCNDTGGLSESVGLRATMGGAYVPVNDAAVTLNTGTLVYKECVLRGIVNRTKENYIAQQARQGARQFETGRTTVDEYGNTIQGPMYVVNLPAEEAARSQTVWNNLLTSGSLAPLSPEVKTALNRNFAMRQNPADPVGCSFTGTPEQLDAIRNGQGTGGMNDVLVLTDPNCIPLEQFYNAQDYADAQAAAYNDTMKTYLGFSNGVYPVQNTSGDIITPGFLVAATIQQQLGAGFEIQKNANDIDQMLVSLLGNIGNQIITAGIGGLQSLINGSLGRLSFLDQAVNVSREGLRNSAVNAGLQILIAARQVEGVFLHAENGLASVLLNNMAKLRAAESTCWNLIIPKVQTYAQAGVRIATSTAFSQGVIDAQISPFASTTAKNINDSNAAILALDQLIAQVTNSNSPDAQSAALQQLDIMVTNHQIHDQYAEQAAEQQLQDVQASVGSRVDDAIRSWGGDPNPNDQTAGWCNYNNPDIIKMWADNWST